MSEKHRTTMNIQKQLHSFAVAAALALSAALPTGVVAQSGLIPQPVSVVDGSGSFTLTSGAGIRVPRAWRATADHFAALLRRSAGLDLKVGAGGPVRLQKDRGLAPEAYSLVVAADGITISASTVAGASHALATLAQLVLTSADGRIPAVRIDDSPRFAYRGLMLDCSRHFWTVDELRETLSHMAFFKLNKLHMHLTDNQAWRFAMDGYPDLTTKGTHYPDFPALSGHFYSKADLRGLVEYAATLGIEVIPEVDMPGHGTALLAAMPQLSCNGGTFAPYPEERPLGERRRVGENMLCIGNPASFEFARRVVDALAEVFPSRYIHFGGDEVSTSVWAKCPKCQDLMKRMGMKREGELQDYFTREMSRYIRSKGKVMIGWDEINDRGAATEHDVLTVWRGDGLKYQQAALERGIPVIMCPQNGCYYDWGYAGNSVRKVYEWDPVGPGVDAGQLPLVMGAQGALWTERIATQDRVEWMLFPRLTALSEVLWTPASGRNWDSFYGRVTACYPVMEKLGINFYADDALNEKEFVPTPEKPTLVRPAVIETNIPANSPYHPEYAFDGRSNSFFWGGCTVDASHYFTVTLSEPTEVNELEVVTGDSKDYITAADLLVSEDGAKFEKVGSFDAEGQAKVSLSGRMVKAVKIQVTGPHTCWPIIKEIMLR